MALKAKSTERLATTVSETKVDEGVEQMKEDQEMEESATNQFKEVMLDFAVIKARGDGTAKLRGLQLNNERNAVVLAVNHKPIACSESGYSADSWSIVPLTVVRVEDPGFCKAPFARGMIKQKMGGAKPLAAVEGTDLRLWSFQKASMAKGDRCDDITFTISPGDTLNTFMNATKYKDMRRVPEPNDHFLPMEEGNTVIPAYSLLEVTLASRNSDAALGKNSGVNILKVRRLPEDVSMHSVAPILTRFPVTLNDALLQSSEKATKFPCISADLVQDKVMFYREKLNPCMVIENVELGETGPGVRITHWSLEATENINSVDIPEDVLLRACNAKTTEHAVALLQIAASMDALSLLIAHNPFDARGGGSVLRGVPFVNVAKMVAKFDTSKFGPLQANSKCQVNTGCEYFDGEGVGSQPIYLEVNVTPTYTDANQDLSIPSKDLPLLMPGYSAAKVYECKINLFPNTDAEPPKEQVDRVLVFYLNASKRSASAGLSTSGVKRKLCSMQWSA
ncbi:hypothetical protein T484DRAFT_1921152 [Baffinella frigidus]|nr:hypothetical protein T484DRAFT_1921152 [Cryptophyta sp. CCMP2293]